MTAQQVVHRPMDVTQIQVVEEIVDVLEVKQVGVPAIQVVQKVVKKGKSVESVTRRGGVWHFVYISASLTRDVHRSMTQFKR